VDELADQLATHFGVSDRHSNLENSQVHHSFLLDGLSSRRRSNLAYFSRLVKAGHISRNMVQ
jgi:hypothetical protein